MKILELVILVILFLGAIKDTPNRLSEKLFERKIQKAKEQSEKAVSEAKKSVSSQESANITSSAIENMRKLSLTFVYLLTMIFYYLVGREITFSVFAVIITALQFLSTSYFYIDSMQNLKNGGFPTFRRIPMFLNVILDYVYYPVAIYILLTV